MTAVLRAQKATLQPATASGAAASEDVMDADLLQLAMESLSEPHSPHGPQLALEFDEIPVPSSQVCASMPPAKACQGRSLI